MLRTLRRFVNHAERGVYIFRNRHSSAVASCLKWEIADFNGVEVNLSQLGDNYSPEEFSVRLKGELKLLHSRNGCLFRA